LGKRIAPPGGYSKMNSSEFGFIFTRKMKFMGFRSLNTKERYETEE